MYSSSYKKYVTVLLLVTYIFNQVDRAIFGILMEPIKREFGLSDAQLGFLGGPALFFFYAILGIPVARWADRSHRLNIMSAAIALWSAIVMASAVVGNFWQFALARVGVGVGEAGFSAVAQSVIADYHHNSAAERTRALAIFMLALPLGAAASNLMGGWVNQAYGWRAAFIVAGLPGIFLALLMKLTVQEPPRGVMSATVAQPENPPLRSVLATLWSRRALRHVAIAITLLTAINGGIFAWKSVFFIRSHGMSTGELGTWLAFNVGVGGSVGIWLGGNLTRRFKIENERLQAQVLAAVAALAWPILTAVFLWPNKTGALLLAFAATVLLNFFLAPAFSLVQGLCAARVRVTMLAAVILLQTMAAGFVGMATGALSDAFSVRLGTEGLRWVLIVMTPTALWAAVHFWLAGRSIRRDLMDVH